MSGGHKVAPHLVPIADDIAQRVKLRDRADDGERDRPNSPVHRGRGLDPLDVARRPRVQVDRRKKIPLAALIPRLPEPLDLKLIIGVVCPCRDRVRRTGPESVDLIRSSRLVASEHRHARPQGVATGPSERRATVHHGRKRGPVALPAVCRIGAVQRAITAGQHDPPLVAVDQPHRVPPAPDALIGLGRPRVELVRCELPRRTDGGTIPPPTRPLREKGGGVVVVDERAVRKLSEARLKRDNIGHDREICGVDKRRPRCDDADDAGRIPARLPASRVVERPSEIENVVVDIGPVHGDRRTRPRVDARPVYGLLLGPLVKAVDDVARLAVEVVPRLDELAGVDGSVNRAGQDRGERGDADGDRHAVAREGRFGVDDACPVLDVVGPGKRTTEDRSDVQPRPTPPPVDDLGDDRRLPPRPRRHGVPVVTALHERATGAGEPPRANPRARRALVAERLLADVQDAGRGPARHVRGGVYFRRRNRVLDGRIEAGGVCRTVCADASERPHRMVEHA